MDYKKFRVIKESYITGKVKYKAQVYKGWWFGWKYIGRGGTTFFEMQEGERSEEEAKKRIIEYLERYPETIEELLFTKLDLMKGEKYVQNRTKG